VIKRLVKVLHPAVAGKYHSETQRLIKDLVRADVGYTRPQFSTPPDSFQYGGFAESPDPIIGVGTHWFDVSILVRCFKSCPCIRNIIAIGRYDDNVQVFPIIRH
jgi:hypothetical protein